MKLKKNIQERAQQSGAKFFYVGRVALRQMNLVREENDALHFRGWYYDMPGHDDFFGGFTSISAAWADCYERFCNGSRPAVRKSTLRAAAGLPAVERVRTPTWDKRSQPKADTKTNSKPQRKAA